MRIEGIINSVRRIYRNNRCADSIVANAPALQAGYRRFESYFAHQKFITQKGGQPKMDSDYSDYTLRSWRSCDSIWGLFSSTVCKTAV